LKSVRSLSILKVENAYSASFGWWKSHFGELFIELS
jgi:hypothetical protein